MRKFEDIYSSIKKIIFEKTKADIAKGTIIDTMIYAFSSVYADIYEFIENNKKPYLFTNQKKDELDSTGYFLQCPRLADESDSNYFYRLQQWTRRNASSNLDAINSKIQELTYSSTADYIPYTHGIGTATLYIIPTSYEGDIPELAIKEAKEKISKVVTPSSVVDYVIPKTIEVKLVVYLDVKKDSDIESIKLKINEEVKKYINSIQPNERLMLGDINKIGINQPGVEYFNVVQLYFDNEENTNFEIVQTINQKFMFDQLIWWEVEK